MNSAKLKKLEVAGWKSGDAADFLGMTCEERKLLEIKLALARKIDVQRKNLGLTQAELAARLAMKQPNVARALAEPAQTSLDRLFLMLFALGNSSRRIASLF